ncbi:hypothetical protein NDU88_002618 [Pleurodeles waltl]|uniref:Uncharacterized protein n=1 Tax=Pleurodeles waltl TaxID=8319 RepID=A0AAV7KW83_PLEWA|nr:hypothetical protein NDU88_002618 [Pleurodeles waltl]
MGLTRRRALSLARPGGAEDKAEACWGPESRGFECGGPDLGDAPPPPPVRPPECAPGGSPLSPLRPHPHPCLLSRQAAAGWATDLARICVLPRGDGSERGAPEAFPPFPGIDPQTADALEHPRLPSK